MIVKKAVLTSRSGNHPAILTLYVGTAFFIWRTKVPKFIDRTGQTYGRLTVVSMVDRGKTKTVLWNCLCECGKTTKCSSSSLGSGNTRSCGCLHSEQLASRNKVHGLAKTREYSTWASMIQRCTNKNEDAYKNYGKRGISVCDEWLFSFEQFYKDMGVKPENHTLERVNNNLGYSAKNCIWETRTTQCRNQRKRNGSTSKYIGASACRKKWQSTISVDKKQIYLGVFDTAYEAAKTRDQYIIDNNLKHFTMNF